MLEEDNKWLVEQFGASRVSELKEAPDFYTFNNGLMYSHRDFDKYFTALKKGEKCSIVSGFNASAAPHIGHISVFDTNLFFQKKYDVSVFIPISEDESYVSGKVETQQEGLRNALVLAKAMVAFGFDTSKTKLIIDQLYTNIYNLAIKLSRGVTLSQIKAVYGYSADQNIGLHFYPTVQAAHVLLPETLGIPNVLVPIGPDEDSHLRTCRDLADKFGYKKPAVLHSIFMPGLDGEKMSKSRGNAIFLLDDEKEIKKKIMSAFSGGATSAEEHRKKGGNPDVDMSYLYLKSFFLSPSESKRVHDEYKSGKMLSGEMKQLLLEHVLKRTREFKERYQKVTVKDLEKVVLTNAETDLAAIAQKSGVFG
jgi:tryptophanyl-tRNA synthetase